MARLNYIPMSRNALPDMSSGQDLSRWMRDNHLDAIYVDPLFKGCEPSVWALVQEQVGHTLKVRFTSEKADVQVLFPTVKRSDTDLQRYVERPWFSSRPRFITHFDVTQS
jgi:hypothetical protein